jgi:hypothetical protein
MREGDQLRDVLGAAQPSQRVQLAYPGGDIPWPGARSDASMTPVPATTRRVLDDPALRATLPAFLDSDLSTAATANLAARDDP